MEQERVAAEIRGNIMSRCQRLVESDDSGFSSDPTTLEIVYSQRYFTELNAGHSPAEVKVATQRFDPAARTVFVDLPGIPSGIGARAASAVVREYLQPVGFGEQLLPIIVLDGPGEGAMVDELLVNSQVMGFIADLDEPGRPPAR
jgi:hypothetical protein